MSTARELIEEGFGDWTREDFVRDAKANGYTHGQANRFATMYLFRLGKLELVPPPVLGWKAFGRPPRPYLKDGWKRCAWLLCSGRHFRLFDNAGRPIWEGGELLACAVARAMSEGWVPT